MADAREPTYAVQLLRPFVKALREYPNFPRGLIDRLEASDPATRIPIAVAQEMFRGSVLMTGDEALGLRAARASDIGDYSVVEYAAGSAATWKAGLDVVFRYCRLMNEAADFRLEVRDGAAYLVLQSSVPLSRPASEFQSAALFVAALRWLTLRPGDVSVWFAHPEPPHLDEYRKTFVASQVLFDKPWDGYVFDAALLDTPMPRADPSLHRVLREHADILLAELDPGDGLLRKVRADIVAALKDGSVGAEHTAARFHMSRRTLARQLRQQGTTYSELLEDVRRSMASRYLQMTRHTVEEIAFLLGYSDATSFVHAFRRWTGKPPLEFRRTHAPS